VSFRCRAVVRLPTQFIILFYHFYFDGPIVRPPQ
jgi:hypothetical protein